MRYFLMTSFILTILMVLVACQRKPTGILGHETAQLILNSISIGDNLSTVENILKENSVRYKLMSDDKNQSIGYGRGIYIKFIQNKGTSSALSIRISIRFNEDWYVESIETKEVPAHIAF